MFHINFILILLVLIYLYFVTYDLKLRKFVTSWYDYLGQKQVNFGPGINFLVMDIF